VITGAVCLLLAGSVLHSVGSAFAGPGEPLARELASKTDVLILSSPTLRRLLISSARVSLQIKLLNMQGNYIGDDGLKAFGEALKLSAHIKALVLAANRMGGSNRVDCTQAFASGINDNHSLQRVDLNYNFFSAEEVRILVRIRGEYRAGGRVHTPSQACLARGAPPAATRLHLLTDVE